MLQQHQAEISAQLEELLDSVCAGPLPVADRLELRRLADALCHASKVTDEPPTNTGRVDAAVKKLPLIPDNLTDRVMQFASKFFPQHLPERMLQFRAEYEHHLILKMSDEGIEEARQFLAKYFASCPEAGGYFECNEEETRKAYLHRFAAAGAAIRYQTLHHKK